MDDMDAAVKRAIRRRELIGIAVIAVVGSLLHFAFAWSGEMPAVAVFAAVNESVFEHLKMTYWPALLYAAIEYRLLKGVANNFMAAKTVGLYVMPAVITVVFYGYTSVAGGDNLVADIILFVGAVALGQLASYRILTRSPMSGKVRRAALVGMISLGVVYAVLTFYPPPPPPVHGDLHRRLRHPVTAGRNPC